MAPPLTRLAAVVVVLTVARIMTASVWRFVRALATVLLNWNPITQTLELREKDDGYREEAFAALTE